MPGRRGHRLGPAEIITVIAAHGKAPEHLRKSQLDQCTSSHLIINTTTAEVTTRAITVAVATVEAMMEEAVGEVDVDHMLAVQKNTIPWELANELKF